MEVVIRALEAVFIDKVEGRTQMPPKTGVYPKDDTFFYAQMSYVSSLDAVAIKWQAGVTANYGRNHPYLTGLFILNDAETGLPRAIMESTWLTAQRTGAASAVTAKLLARSDSKVLSLLGCGVQARTQLEALAMVCGALETVVCYDIRPANSAAFAREMKERYSHLVFTIVDTAEEATRIGDIVVTSGPITKNAHRTIEPGWLGSGALALPIDYDCYWQPAALHEADKFYVDHLEQFQHFQQQGDYFADTPEVVGDLGQLLAGQVPGRERAEERIIAINMGISIEDVASAVQLYQRAVEAGIGTVLPLYE